MSEKRVRAVSKRGVQGVRNLSKLKKRILSAFTDPMTFFLLDANMFLIAFFLFLYTAVFAFGWGNWSLLFALSSAVVTTLAESTLVFRWAKKNIEKYQEEIENRIPAGGELFE
jgi:hypothetical protein